MTLNHCSSMNESHSSACVCFCVKKMWKKKLIIVKLSSPKTYSSYKNTHIMANKIDKLLLCQKKNKTNQTNAHIPDGHRQMVHIPLKNTFSFVRCMFQISFFYFKKWCDVLSKRWKRTTDWDCTMKYRLWFCLCVYVSVSVIDSMAPKYTLSMGWQHCSLFKCQIEPVQSLFFFENKLIHIKRWRPLSEFRSLYEIYCFG